MGQISNEGVAIAVPAYYLCAAILLFLALTSGVVAVRRSRLMQFGSFAGFCLAGAALSLSIAAYYQSDSAAEGLHALARVAASEALLLAGSMVMFAAYSQSGRYGRWAIGAVMLVVSSLALQFALPGGARLAVVTASGWALFSWGELLFYLHGRPGPWMFVFYGLAVLLLGWAATRVRSLHHWGEKRASIFLTISIVLMAAAFAHGAAIDFTALRSFQSLPLATFCVALLMGISLLEGFHARADVQQSPADADRHSQVQPVAMQGKMRDFSDPLTGLPNRMFVHDHLSGMIQRGPPESYGAVLVCVLAHYEVSDRAMTQAFTDELMREVTVRLADGAKGRAVVARTSADSFAALLQAYFIDEDDAAAGVEAVARDLAEALARPMRLGDYALNIVSRFGMATFQTQVSLAAEVLARAESSLRHAGLASRTQTRALPGAPGAPG